MQELANVLGRERVQLEFLLFKILQLQHLLRAGDNRFLRWAADEIVRASRAVQLTELNRSRQVKELAFAVGTFGVAVDQVTLAELAEHSREPWRTIFADHSINFRLLLAEVDAVLEMTTALADAHGHAVANVLKEMPRPALSLSNAGQFAAPESMVLP